MSKLKIFDRKCLQGKVLALNLYNNFVKINPNWPQDLVNQAQTILSGFKTGTFLPERSLVLRFLELDPFSLKVVMLGQDPYPQPFVANGFAFATYQHQPIPASLKTIFAEVKTTQGFLLANQTLSHWIDQGVLLLNTSLTIGIDQTSHFDWWVKLIDQIIVFLSTTTPSLIWVLWGKHAQNFEGKIKAGVIIKDAHPSPLARRFRKGNTFSEIAKHLKILF